MEVIDKDDFELMNAIDRVEDRIRQLTLAKIMLPDGKKFERMRIADSLNSNYIVWSYLTGKPISCVKEIQ